MSQHPHTQGPSQESMWDSTPMSLGTDATQRCHSCSRSLLVGPLARPNSEQVRHAHVLCA